MYGWVKQVHISLIAQLSQTNKQTNILNANIACLKSEPVCGTLEVVSDNAECEISNEKLRLSLSQMGWVWNTDKTSSNHRLVQGVRVSLPWWLCAKAVITVTAYCTKELSKTKTKAYPSHTQQNTLSITLPCSAGWSFKDWNNICSVRRRSATRTWMGCYTIRACAFFILRVVTFCRNSKVLAIWGLPNNPERFSVTVVRSRRVVAVTSSSAINFSFCLHLHWYVYSEII